MTDGKQRILARVREALRVPTNSAARKGAGVLGPEGPPFRGYLPQVGGDVPSRLEHFAALSRQLKTNFVCAENLGEAQAEVGRIAAAEGWRRVGCHAAGLVSAVISGLDVETVSTDAPYDREALESCDAGITACEALVAQTGSVLVSTRSSGGRALSVLPPHHVVLATLPQLVGDLPEALEKLQTRYQASWPSFVSLITGPSRTGDIERILVLGAHGPKRLTVVLLLAE